MTRQTYTFSIDVEVDDETTLFSAALRYAKEVDGLSHESAMELLKPEGERDMGACLSMILDPGYIPGCSVHESRVE